MGQAQLLLLPFSWLYAVILRLRHALYDSGLLKSRRPEVPTIVVGNLSFGGTGKTPHVELVLRCLEGIAPLATLSRGYGRNGFGTLAVEADDEAYGVGDEPLQFKRKFPEAHVYVGAERVKAIGAIVKDVSGLKAVVLDDAFQHRPLNAGLNILLTTWAKPWFDDHLVPAGTLRDVPSRVRAAQMVVVTKCPRLPTTDEQRLWRERLRLSTGQHLFFSGLDHAEPRLLEPTGALGQHVPLSGASVLLLTGIADPAPLVSHVKGLVKEFAHLPFPDHHTFSSADLQKAVARLATFAAGPKLLVTTEKDAMRLLPHLRSGPLANITIVVIGVEAVILNEPERFTALLRHYVATHQANR
ncbi:MAG: tetraacyldisaccharide 4'-kinase [Flavobacteriales bacterium]